MVGLVIRMGAIILIRYNRAVITRLGDSGGLWRILFAKSLGCNNESNCELLTLIPPGIHSCHPARVRLYMMVLSAHS